MHLSDSEIETIQKLLEYTELDDVHDNFLDVTGATSDELLTLKLNLIYNTTFLQAD